jgi:hypothetical protein
MLDRNQVKLTPAASGNSMNNNSLLKLHEK